MPSRTRGFVVVPDVSDGIDGQEEQAPAGRVCQETGCVTVLSRYNSTSWCGLHSRRDWRANREPRRRSAEAS